MNTLEIAARGTHLSSRSTGRELRGQLIRLVERDGEVQLDFAGVQTVSHSFADELLGVLIQRLGEDWFREHVRVVNHTPAVRLAVLDAIHLRLTAPPREAA